MKKQLLKTKLTTLVSKIDTNYEVTQGLCDYYNPPEDEKELAKQIKVCLKKEYTIDEMQAASEQIYQSYNYKMISQKYMEFFRSLA